MDEKDIISSHGTNVKLGTLAATIADMEQQHKLSNTAGPPVLNNSIIQQGPGYSTVPSTWGSGSTSDFYTLEYRQEAQAAYVSPAAGVADMVAYIVETKELYDEGVHIFDIGTLNFQLDMEVLKADVNNIFSERSLPVRFESGGLIHKIRQTDDGVYTRSTCLKVRIRDVTLLEVGE